MPTDFLSAIYQICRWKNLDEFFSVWFVLLSTSGIWFSRQEVVPGPLRCGPGDAIPVLRVPRGATLGSLVVSDCRFIVVRLTPWSHLIHDQERMGSG